MNRAFAYFGSKTRMVWQDRYSPPRYPVIVEPFAGSAAYSLRYGLDRDVILIEYDPRIAGIWSYLISATKQDILDLPILKVGDYIPDLKIPLGARWLLGMWIGWSATKVQRTFGREYGHDGNSRCIYWGVERRQELSELVPKIKHWQIRNTSYQCAQDIEATWFIDPPYMYHGSSYTCGSKGIDYYGDLPRFCKSRKGQVIVCEGQGAKWLDFKTLCSMSGSNNYYGPSRKDKPTKRKYDELVWTND
jgi:site-specific DNA-adenine methylase